MTRAAGLAIGVLAVAIAAGTGYWYGNRGKETGAAAPAAAPATAKVEKKVLYYRNPMGLADTSPVPKKDPMGMDYIAVYDGDAAALPDEGARQIRISTEKVQKLGVRTEAAKFQVLDKVVQAAGRIEPDERRIYTIAPKFEGYVERLHVNVTGQPVSRGQVLFEAYSPELISAQREYLIAAQGLASVKGAGDQAQAGMKQLADSSLLRLRNWDISDEQIAALARSGDTRRTLAFRSPVAGIVTEKRALQGMRFMPGEALYQVTDLSAVWVVADVFEQDIALVKTGAPVKVRINAYPDKVFQGTVTYVYPTLAAQTRTVPVRIELPNPGQLLKPAMFAQVELAVGARAKVVTVPSSAVIDSGVRRIVLVQAGEGRFEPREVRLGQRGNNDVEVLEGVQAGEAVVVAANFLLDAESNLQAAIGGFGHANQGGTPKQEEPVPARSPPQPRPGKPAIVGHRAEGTVEDIDAKAGAVTLNHGPVASLKWPAMSMEFLVAHPALLAGLKPGAVVSFEFVERKPGEWVITAIKPMADARPGAAPAADAHPKY